MLTLVLFVPIIAANNWWAEISQRLVQYVISSGLFMFTRVFLILLPEIMVKSFLGKVL